MDRRAFITSLGRSAALASVTPAIWRLRWHPRFADDPFTLGVASGDPTPSGVVLWTRLAPRPLEPFGGMGTERAVVRWEVADDEAFSRVRARGNATAVPELAHSVHVEVNGLDPDRWYFYRFTSGEAASPVGRMRTAPRDDSERGVRFAFVGCNHYEQGLYTAYDHLADEEVDFVAHLGDYIYENATTPTGTRRHLSGVLRTLDEYRARYALYKSDAMFQRAHARCPWVITWDDHEVYNNYSALDVDSAAATPDAQRARRGAAYQAWWEHQPVRIAATRTWPALRIYRTMNWGRTARFWTLDGRQYRRDQACGDGTRPIPCGDWNDPARPMLGREQERWLIDGLGRSGAGWQVLVNQVTLSPPDVEPTQGARVDMDKWSGYPAERDRVLAAIAERAPNRTVVLTGDIHSNWVYDVRRGFDRKGERPIVAAEFIGTSISSGGDGGDTIARINDAYLAANPSLKWANNRRGYVVVSLGAEDCRADYRTVSFVTRPHAPVRTASAWRVERGRAGLEMI